ncbi:NineTeen Complex (NTC) component [Allomyces arbusculus]|nr:NineTeen Complex (NTC) component [Allomyces arbusculus]
MARNQEKAQSMLYRFREAEMAELGLSGRDKRPPHTRMVENVHDAERWRGQVIGEITRKVTRIHDPVLTDAQIRDLNDDINKLFKEKWMWERRIQELGGPDYTRKAPNRMDKEGKEIAGMRGYKYFGRARDLPGVKEFFAAQVKEEVPKDELPKFDRTRLDAEYFGFIEDPDVVAFEEELQAQQTQQYLASLGPKPDDLYADDRLGELLMESAHLADLPFLPTAHDVEEWMVERRKQELLAKYADG